MSMMIVPKSFAEAIRDSGYKGVSAALSELIDNALEAHATNINISFSTRSSPQDLEVRVLDDGRGMSKKTLSVALKFGGSTRFGSREGMGRFGMGLPCAALSLARRVDVFSWQRRTDVWTVHFDIDELSDNVQFFRSSPKTVPPNIIVPRTNTGTLIVLSQCDRVQLQHLPQLRNELHEELGRSFRTFLYKGISLRIDGEPVEPEDPLFRRTGKNPVGARAHGPALEYKIRSAGGNGRAGLVKVVFVELPVAKWCRLPNAEKNRARISKRAGVSVIRSGREIDYGWYFMGSKRKENYDDWWRCEISFPSVLDELFGVTHTKQRINPHAILNSILTPDIERIARKLNLKVRKTFMALSEKHSCQPLRKFALKDHLLEPPLRSKSFRVDREAFPLRLRNCGLGGLTLKLESSSLDQDDLYVPELTKGILTIVLNSNHLFAKNVYGPAVAGDKSYLDGLHALVLALARAEMYFEDPRSLKIIERFRETWGRCLTAYLS